MPIKITRSIPCIKVNPNEFNITNLFIDCLELECGDDFIIYDGLRPLICGEKYLCYTDTYWALKYIPLEDAIFRPLKYEKHANIIIDMFDRLDIIDMDSLEVEEKIINGKKKYCGYMKKNGKIVNGSYVKHAPTIPILKCSVIAKMLFDDCDYDIFKSNLMGYLKRGIR